MAKVKMLNLPEWKRRCFSRAPGGAGPYMEPSFNNRKLKGEKNACKT